MFKHILVPLDGSMRAAQALLIAARIARAQQSTLLLLEIIDPIYEIGLPSLSSQEPANPQMATTYLQHTAYRPDLEGIEVKTQVAAGIPAEQILLAAAQQHTDLIVMCSHGRTGLKRWAMGSVAQRVSRSSPVPVLVLQEDDQLLHQTGDQEAMPVRIMVALDGSPMAEKSLVPTAYLCSALSTPAQGTLQLTLVLHLPSCFEYGQDDSVSRALRKELPVAQEYLEAVKRRLQEHEISSLQLKITTVITHDLDVANQLLKIAERGEKQDGTNCCQLIALTTHGRSGLQRLVTGSVTECILSRARRSLLIITP
ncbi:universal stress protein [Tengunoibacter tsumagoiensis]|uniref:Universal stress protein UspA n=1 Tax=Tengunoibacter tsumagoiensis TaxID=2014871 RepID=A0A402A719_9CHLR|nr:universal stress protein [Tengunoibacter tsumagoiensis]GCE14835.1 universal stress protein UspA [Tengunoibacter tsumagoiensis]